MNQSPSEPCATCPIHVWAGIRSSADEERKIRADERRLLAREWSVVLDTNQQVRLQQGLRSLDVDTARECGLLLHVINSAMEAIREEAA